MSSWRWIGGLLFLCLILLLFVLYRDLFTFEYLKSQQSAVQDMYRQQPVLTLAAFFIGYLLYGALALPGVNLFMILSGAVFGFWVGMLLTSVASTLSACLVFLWSRYFFRNRLLTLFGDRLQVVDEHIRRDGLYYVLLTRLTAGVPASLVNILSGLSALHFRHFLLAVLVAQLIAAITLNLAGSLAGDMITLSEAMSPRLLILMAVIGISPLLIHLLKRRYRQ